MFRFLQWLSVSMAIILLSACGGSSGGGTDMTALMNSVKSTTISGYVEDDPLANATVVLKDVSGKVIAETETDENGKYTLEATLKKMKFYSIESRGMLNDRNITLHSVFEFNDDSIVNVNPITEITYLLHKESNDSLDSINTEVLSYYGITESTEARGIRFLKDSKAYEGMKKFTESGLPVDSINLFKADIKDGKNLRLSVVDDLKIIPSSKTVEVGKSIELTLNKKIADDYNVTWAGIDKGGNCKITSLYPGNREIAVKISKDGKEILSTSTTVNFYKLDAKKSISIADNSLEQNSTVDDITITIPKNSVPSDIKDISIANIETGEDSVFKTFKMEPSGTVFSEPLVVRIPYDLDSIEDPSNLYIERLEDDGSVELLKAEIDYKKQELVFKTNHFSVFTIRTDSDKRKYVADTYFDDIEDRLFVTDGKYNIKLSSLKIANMSELIKDSIDGDYLSTDAKKIMQEFYDAGYNYKLDGFDKNYEKAFKYVLAENVVADDLTQSMNKYELLVDSLKKYRVAKLIDAYIANDMLVRPYDYWGIGETTRSDFFNELLSVEQETYGLVENKAFHVNSNATLDAIMSIKDTTKILSDTAKSILDNGFLKTGVSAGWGLVQSYIINEVKHEIGKHFTNESLTHLQCFNYEESFFGGDYMIGDTIIFTLYNDGTVEADDLSYFYDVVEELEKNAGDYHTDFDLSDDQKKFAECIYNKIYLLEEDKTLTGNLMDGGKALASKQIRHDIWKTTNELYTFVSNGSLEKYDSLLKILNFNKEQLQKYSKYLKTIAISNAQSVISDIIVEAKLDDGYSIEEIKDDGFFRDDISKEKALIKFKTYYATHSTDVTSKESVDSIDVYSLDAFKNIKLKIDKKYMEKFSLDMVQLDIKYISLEKKIAEDGISDNYYETTGSFKELTLKKSDIKIDDYILNEETGKYEISLDNIFKDIDVSEIAYLDAKLSVNITYSGKPYYLDKSFVFIADSTPEKVVLKKVEKGGFRLLVKDELANPISGVSIAIGTKSCETDSSGECSIKDLVPAEYEISLIKEGYFPEYKNSFIDMAAIKDIEFTLKSATSSDSGIALDVSAVRSEVNPMEYKFYINAEGSDLDLNISFGDGEFIADKLSYLLAKETFITHVYKTKGIKNVTVELTDSKENTNKEILDVYPIDSDKVVDVVFLVDLSGSYGSSLNVFKAQAIEIANGFSTLGSDTRVGLASFDEFPSYANSDDFAYAQNKELTYDFDAFNYAVNNMILKWGGDTPESQLEGLYQVAKTFNWQDTSEKYIFIATDASFHNSDIEDDYPGKGYKETLAALKEKNIKVIGLNRGGTEIDDVTKVVKDTGGTIFYLDSSSSDIVNKIMEFSETDSGSISTKSSIKTILGSVVEGINN